MRTTITLLALLLALPVAAEEITVDKLLAAQSFDVSVAALLAKAPPAAAAPTPSALQPDNPKLVTLVRAVQAGTSESLLIDQIKQTGVTQRPSLNDLIYMKDNRVPATSSGRPASRRRTGAGSSS